MLADLRHDISGAIGRLIDLLDLVTSISPLGAAMFALGSLLMLHPVRFQTMEESTPPPTIIKRITIAITLQQLLFCGVALMIGQGVVKQVFPPATLLGFGAFCALGLSQTKHAIHILVLDKLRHEEAPETGYFATHTGDRIGLNVVAVLPPLVIGYCAFTAIMLALAS